MNINNCGSQGRMIPKLPAIENLIVEKEHKDYSMNLHDPSTPINIDQNNPSRHLLREFEMEEEGAYVN